MHIPRAWAKASAECQTPDKRRLSIAVWGWGSEEAAAQREASSRLERLLGRVRRGEPFPDAYAYGNRPPREEILETLDGDTGDEPRAILTRNRYGALVLNTARVLFLDVDVAPPTLGQRLRRLLPSSRAPDDAEAMARLGAALRRFGRATFRVYRTAAGLRAIAIDREFDPVGRETQELMSATGTDPAFVRLCAAQKSFRARLTPKPWRCQCSLPPGQHPRTDDVARQRFAAWVGQYELAARGYATCRYVETIGLDGPRSTIERLVALHDRITRSGEALPLA